MRTDLSPSLVHHLGGAFFRPSYLVELTYEVGQTPWRWCTNQDNISWDGYTWSLMGFSINGLTWDSKITSKISLEIQNIDQEIASVVLDSTPSRRLADKPINIWMLYLYDRSMFYADVGNTSGSTQITVTEAIPADMPISGTIYIGASPTLGATGSPGYSYSSWSGRTFTLTSGLTTSISEGRQCYILKTTYEADDAVKVFSGVVDDIELDEKRCRINLAPESTKTQFTPRRYITKYNGFSKLPQTGLKINWAGENYTLERAKY